MNSKKILGTSFVIIIIIFSALSLITIASLSFPKGKEGYYQLIKQGLWLFLGWISFWITANINYKKYKNIVWYLYSLGVAMLLAVLVIGKTTNGAKRWINLGMGIVIQPSEFAKILLILVLVSFKNYWENKPYSLAFCFIYHGSNWLICSIYYRRKSI